MLRLRFQNFRKFRDFEWSVPDEERVSVILGYNEAGKSTIANGIKLALVGEAYGRKGKTITELTTRGQAGLSVQVKTGHWSAHRTDHSGDSISEIADRLGVPAAQLPLLFDSKMAGDGGNKALKDYLSGTSAAKFDPAVEFKDHPQILTCVTQARRAGKLLTAHIIKYCEDQRAASKAPAPLPRPESPKPSDEALQALSAQLVTEEAAERAAHLEHQESLAFGHKTEALVKFVKDSAAYEAAMKLSSIGDPLGEQREKLISAANINVQSIANAAELYRVAGYLGAANALSDALAAAKNASADARATVASNPPPAAMPTAPALSDEARAFYDQIKAMFGEVTLESLAKVATMAADAYARTGPTHGHWVRRVHETRQQRDKLMRDKGAWENYEGRSAQVDTARLNAENDWNRWDTAAKSIAFAEKAHMDAQGKQFATTVSAIAAGMLQGRQLTVSPVTGIMLDSVPITEVSESTKWRMEIVVMASIAYSLSSPLLLIDGFDILDHFNREELYKFIFSVAAPYFQHTIMTATPRFTVEQEPLITTRPVGLPAGAYAGFWYLDSKTSAIKLLSTTPKA